LLQRNQAERILANPAYSTIRAVCTETDFEEVTEISHFRSAFHQSRSFPSQRLYFIFFTVAALAVRLIPSLELSCPEPHRCWAAKQ
jgi:hypothetical protein